MKGSRLKALALKVDQAAFADSTGILESIDIKKLASSIDPKEHSSAVIAFEEIRIIYQFNEKVQDVGEGWGPFHL
jgi:hypothetical protein